MMELSEGRKHFKISLFV